MPLAFHVQQFSITSTWLAAIPGVGISEVEPQYAIIPQHPPRLAHHGNDVGDILIRLWIRGQVDRTRHNHEGPNKEDW